MPHPERALTSRPTGLACLTHGPHTNNAFPQLQVALKAPRNQILTCINMAEVVSLGPFEFLCPAHWID